MTAKTYCRIIQRTKKYNTKLYHTTGNVGFIKKKIHHEVTPKFAHVKGNFININDRYKSKKCILLSHLNNHVHSHKLLIKKHHYSNSFSIVGRMKTRLNNFKKPVQS